MGEITVNIRSSTEAHSGKITVKNEKYAFLRLVAMIKCAESGIYKIDSLDGVPEALQATVEDMRIQRDLAIDAANVAKREAAEAKLNSDTVTIARLNRELTVKNSEFELQRTRHENEIARIRQQHEYELQQAQVRANLRSPVLPQPTLTETVSAAIRAPVGTTVKAPSLEID